MRLLVCLVALGATAGCVHPASFAPTIGPLDRPDYWLLMRSGIADEGVVETRPKVGDDWRSVMPRSLSRMGERWVPWPDCAMPGPDAE